MSTRDLNIESTTKWTFCHFDLLMTVSISCGQSGISWTLIKYHFLSSLCAIIPSFWKIANPSSRDSVKNFAFNTKISLTIKSKAVPCNFRLPGTHSSFGLSQLKWELCFKISTGLIPQNYNKYCCSNKI